MKPVTDASVLSLFEDQGDARETSVSTGGLGDAVTDPAILNMFGVDPPAPAAPEEPGVLGQLGLSARSGLETSKKSLSALAASQDLIEPETAGSLISKSTFVPEGYERPADVTDFEHQIDAGDYLGAMKNLVTNPIDIVGTYGAEGLGTSVLPLVAGGLGAAAGAATPVPGGAVAGGASALGVGSGVIEAGASMLESFEDYGVNMKDRDAIVAAFNDPEIMEFAKDRALKGGITVGLFDAATAGVAGVLMRGAKGPLSALVRGTGELGIQMGGGAGGEAAKQVITEGAVTQPSAVVAEALGETATGAIEVGGGVLARGRTTRSPEEPEEPSILPKTKSALEAAMDAATETGDQNRPQETVAAEEVTAQEGAMPRTEAPNGEAVPRGDAPASSHLSSTPEEVEAERAKVAPEPTPAQAEADNYKQGHVRLAGLPLSIETPKGGTRRDTKSEPPRWKVENFPADYGKIRGTKGADGEHVDFFMGEDREASHAFVIDQIDPKTGRFDEHKVMLGFQDFDQALATYDAAFTDRTGPERRGAVTPMTIEEFRAWLESGDTTKPLNFAEVKSVGLEVAPDQEAGFEKHIAQTQKFIDTLKAETTGGQMVTAATLQKNVPGMTPDQARRMLGHLKSQGTLTRGGRIPKAREKPRTPIDIIRDMGGIQPTGETRAMDLQTVSPGTVSKRGKTAHEIREHFEEIGLLSVGSGDDAVHQLIDDTIRGNPSYHPDDADLVDAQQDKSEQEFEESTRGDAEAQVRAVLEEHGIDLTPAEIDEVTAELAGTNQDPLDVVSDYVERAAMESADDIGVELTQDEEVPFDVDESANDAPQRDDLGARAQGEAEAVAEGAPEGETDGAEPSQAGDGQGESGPVDEALRAKPELGPSFDDPKGDTQQAAVLRSALEGRRSTKEPLTGNWKWLLRNGYATEERYGKLKITDAGRERLAELEAADSETTPEGEQTLIPGVTPVTDRDRAEVRGDKALRSDKSQKPADEGLFDTGARNQQDMFDATGTAGEQAPAQQDRGGSARDDGRDAGPDTTALAGAGEEGAGAGIGREPADGGTAPADDLSDRSPADAGAREGERGSGEADAESGVRPAEGAVPERIVGGADRGGNQPGDQAAVDAGDGPGRADASVRKATLKDEATSMGLPVSGGTQRAPDRSQAASPQDLENRVRAVIAKLRNIEGENANQAHAQAAHIEQRFERLGSLLTTEGDVREIERLAARQAGERVVDPIVPSEEQVRGIEERAERARRQREGEADAIAPTYPNMPYSERVVFDKDAGNAHKGKALVPQDIIDAINAQERLAIDLAAAYGIPSLADVNSATAPQPVREAKRQLSGMGGLMSRLANSLYSLDRGHKRAPTQEIVDGLVKNMRDELKTSRLNAEAWLRERQGPQVSENKIFTEDAADKARELLRKKLSGTTLNSGFDPEILQAGITLAGYHVEAGARKFADFARVMVGDMGDTVRPYLKSWYNALRDYPGFDADGLTPYDEVAAFDVEGDLDALGSSTDLERDSGDAGPSNVLRETDVPAVGTPDEHRTGRGEPEAQDQGRDEPGGQASLFDDGAAPVGARGNRDVRAGAPRDGASPAERGGRKRSGDDGGGRLPDDRNPAKAVAKTSSVAAGVKQKRAAQRAAESVPTKPAKLDNIRETLPFLRDAQQDDVYFAEQRFSKPDGHGVLFTNGTGTGKTYTGLGIVKRFARQGKDNTLIVVPSKDMAEVWKTAGKDLDLDISILENTEDAGKGTVVTTFANFGQNRHLADREWDLVIPDESQQLMASQNAADTDALRHMRAITHHPDGLSTKGRMIERKLVDEIEQLKVVLKGQIARKNPAELEATERNSDKLDELLKELDKKVKAHVEVLRDKPRSKAVFLSATPFAWVENLDYAEGYLFEYPKVTEQGGYNQPDGRSQFYIENFGYRMRTGKLTKPEADVNSEVMEREFHEKLKRTGALSGRMLDVDADYDRKFVLVDDAIGNRIDALMEFLWSADNGRFLPLSNLVRKRFDYLARRRLLEAMKAHHAVDVVKQHQALGRKVVVFHDYNAGAGFNPFTFDEGQLLAAGEETRYVDGKPVSVKIIDLYNEFIQRNPDALEMKFSKMRNPIETLTSAFPNALLYNGTVTPKNRNLAKAQFNEDGSGRDLIVVQSAAGEFGISLHDTTGKHQRVMLNLGMPNRPVTAIQEEGRIYRTGQVTDAAFRYLNTGTSWERWAFAGSIAERSSTAENLAMGSQARALKESFIDAFLESDAYPASAEDGKGGKEQDRVDNSLSPFERSKTFYFAQQKQKGRRDQRKGIDYFPTPEPVGFKMVEFADIKPGEKVLEPSAGHGAIARFFPESAQRTMIEPSGELAGKAALASPGARVLDHRFEDLHVTNKYDAIVMNPPYGSGGKTAIDHLSQAVKHLRNGGRIVALLPRGGMADKRFDQWYESDASKGVYVAANIDMPVVTFERAGTKIASRIVVLEKQTDADVASNIQAKNRDYTNAEKINELFDRIEDAEFPARQEPVTKELDINVENGTVVAGGIEFELKDRFDGSFTLKAKKFLGRDVFARLARLSDDHKGHYDASLTAFVFPDAEKRQQYLEALERGDAPAPAETAKPEGVSFTTGETTHSKTGEDLYVASLDGRVDRDTYTAVNAIAKKHGGYYSRFKARGAIPGFQFRTEAERTAFIAEAADDSDSLYAIQDEPAAVIAGDVFGDRSDLRALRERARAFGRESLYGRLIENEDQGIKVRVNRRGLGKIFSHGPNPETILAVAGIEDFIRAGKQKGGELPDVAGDPTVKYRQFETTAVIDGDLYGVEFTIRRGEGGVFYYDHDVRLKLNPGGSSGGRANALGDSARRGQTSEEADNNVGPGAAESKPDDTLEAVPAARAEVVQATEKQIRSLIQRIAPQLKGLKIVDGEIRTSTGLPVDGRYSTVADLMQIALSSSNPLRAARHETIHHLKNMGLFTPAEWKALTAMARKAWMGEYNIERLYGDVYRERYGEQAEAIMLEEAIAYAYSDWQAGALKPQNAVRAVFEKVKKFFAAIARILKGQGFNTYEDVFGRVDAGEVGARPIAETLQEAFATKEPDQIRAALARVKRDVNPPTKEQLLKGLRAAGLKRLARLYQQTPQSAQEPLRESVGEPVDELYALDGTFDGAAPETAPAGHKNRVLGTAEQEAAIRSTMAVHDPVPLKERAVSLVDQVKNLDWVALKQNTIDQFASFEAYEKAVRGKVSDAAMSAYKMARMTQNLQSVMSAVLHHGPLEIADGGFRVRQGFEGGFQGIFTPLAEDGLLHLWKGWAAATRAKRLMEEGREANFSSDQIEALLPLGREYPQFQEVMDKWQAYNRAMLDMAEQAGLINAEQREIWEKDDYVPFYRVIEDSVTAPRNRTGLANQRSGIKTLTGSEEQIGDIIENMVLNMTHLVDASFKNVATQRLLEVLEEGGMNEGEVVSSETMDWKIAHVSPADAANKLRDIGVDVEKVPASERDTWLKLFTMAPPKDPDVVSVMIEGKPQYYRVHDPLLLSSLATLRPEGADLLMDALRIPKRALTVGVTTMPGFMIRNFIRDTLHSWVVTGEDFTPFVDSAKGFMKSLREDTSLISIMGAGGGSGGFYRNEAKDVRKQLDRRLKGINKQTVIDTPLKAFELWRKIGQASENANRIALHDAIKKRGGSDAEAAFQAMNLLDFSMRGDARAVRFLIETIPFLNARLQGLHRMYQGARENPKTFMLRGGVIMGASLALVAANWGDERYDDLEEWDKDTYYHIFLDNLFPIEALKAVGIDADQWHLRMPKPFEIGAIFSTIPERILRASTGKDDMKVAGRRMLAVFHDTFAVDSPQFIRPIIEQVANVNFFTDRPVVPRRLENMILEAQYTSRTSGTARLLGELTGTSPIRIDELVRGYGGTLGMYLMQATGGIINAARGDRPVKPEWRADRIPEIGGFIRNHPSTTTKYVTEFYDMREEAKALYLTFREYRRQGRTDDAKALVAKNAPKIRGHKALSRAGRTMGNMSRRARAIEDHPTMSAQEKRRQLTALQVQRNKLAKRIVTMLKEKSK